MELPKRISIPDNDNRMVPEKGKEYISNPHYGKRNLTFFEALDVINMLSAQLMVDSRYRGADGTDRDAES